jgi:multimeric flavodoxin WrbA
MSTIELRKGMPSVELSHEEFARRFRVRFQDPAFDKSKPDIERLMEIAWEAYSNSRKSPYMHPAGPGYADPAYQLSDEWRAASKAVHDAEKRYRDPSSRSRILLINGSARSEHTCPGEMSKSFRLITLAQEIVAQERDFEVDLLDLSNLTSEYGRAIYPCKSCLSTAMPLCHWPCSCYPNHALGQVGDWMHDIYPKWVDAHGIMIVCPVNWYQAPSALKLMIDRLVCADGGNPDPTSTGGKDPSRAKQLELAGWDYPRHLAGRVFSVVVHGDASGVDTLRRSLSDWLNDMHLISAGNAAQLGRYVGYYKLYATSHLELDADIAVQEEVRNAARSLVKAVTLRRSGHFPQPDAELREPRSK